MLPHPRHSGKIGNLLEKGSPHFGASYRVQVTTQRMNVCGCVSKVFFEVLDLDVFEPAWVGA